MESRPITLEELGVGGNVTLDVIVEYEIDEGEPAEQPSKNNETGYPGSPSSLIVHKVTVTEYDNGKHTQIREENPVFFDLLDRQAKSIVESKIDYYFEYFAGK